MYILIKMKFIIKKLVLFIFILLVSCLIFVIPTKSAPDSTFPRLANYFLKWEITDAEARQLAKWDLLILDMEVQEKSLAQLKKIRELNPKIIILAYITSQEIRADAGNSYSSLRKQLVSGIPESWYLHNSAGNKISWWPGTYLLNVTDSCPTKNNLRFNQYLVNFVVEKILATQLWDGVYYDNAWDNITYFVGSDIDLDNNKIKDTNLDNKWKTGMKFIYNETRRLTADKYIIVGNGNTREYRSELNGKMLENFIAPAWTNTMNTYEYNFGTTNNPKINIINVNTSNTGNQNYKNMRFGLASALMEDGYYSFDYGDKDHSQTWWYDEYNVNLGDSLSSARSKNNYSTYEADIWQRDFTNGIVLVNSTPQKQLVSLGGEYEKIHGIQDTKVNNGLIVTETMIDGYDGLLLLKVVSSLKDVLFRNGDFVRFVRPDGTSVRNGFFIFEDNYKGGDKIAHIDLDGNGKRDLLVVTKNKLLAWRDDGQPFMKVYPYTASYPGELNVSIGDLNNDGYWEVYVAPEAGYAYPIKIYTRHGRQMKRDWYPFGGDYKGGYSLAVGRLSSIRSKNLVVAKKTEEPLISIFDYNYNMAYQWFAFDRNFGTGVNVATGNVDGVGLDELIVGAGVGANPVVRIYNVNGKQLYNEIKLYSSLGKPGVEVLSADVDFDGKDDIIGMSGGF